MLRVALDLFSYLFLGVNVFNCSQLNYTECSTVGMAMGWV